MFCLYSVCFEKTSQEKHIFCVMSVTVITWGKLLCNRFDFHYLSFDSDSLFSLFMMLSLCLDGWKGTNEDLCHVGPQEGVQKNRRRNRWTGKWNPYICLPTYVLQNLMSLFINSDFSVLLTWSFIGICAQYWKPEITTSQLNVTFFPHSVMSLPFSLY